MHDAMHFFGHASWTRVGVFLLLGPFLFGNLVSYLRRRFDLNDGYSRKLHHIGIMVIAGPSLAVLPDIQLMPSVLIATTALIVVSTVATYSSRRLIAGMAEHSLRRRDAPHSRFFYLMPMVTSNIAIAISSLLYPLSIVKIAFFTVAFADGLAEPVGVRFGGSNTYTVRDLVWGWTNTKSVAGSSAVFLMSALVSTIMLSFLGQSMGLVIAVSLGYALLTTAIEAVSPRGLDNMMIMLISPLFLVLVGLVL